MKKITVLGGGSWGTAIARLLTNKGHMTSLYILDKEQASLVEETKENPNYLPGVKLPEALTITTSIVEAIKNVEIAVLAVPTNAVRSVLNEIKDILDKNVIIVNLAKGIEVDSLDRISEIVGSILPVNPFAVLSGPSHAEEVGKDIPTAVTVASDNIEVARYIQEVFVSTSFRVYTHKDLVGVEMGGALKNIIALAAGMSDGLGYGDNTKAALMTRGMYEMSKLGIQLGGLPQTFHGLSGMGDLIVTCTSMHSRNRRCGILIGQGSTVEEAIQEVGMVVEGIKTTKSAFDLSKKFHVEMPITEKLYEVLYKDANPREAVISLMNREKKDEIEEMFLNKTNKIVSR